LAFVLTTLYGITDEIHQLYVPGRHGQPADVLFDAAGALAMILLIRRIAWLRTMPEALNLPLIRLSGGQS
jgi:VanZ family protein